MFKIKHIAQSVALVVLVSGPIAAFAVEKSDKSQGYTSGKMTQHPSVRGKNVVVHQTKKSIPEKKKETRKMSHEKRHDVYWVPGDYFWDGNDWVWAGGYWADQPFFEAEWVPGHWVNHWWGYSWVPGYWR